MVRRLRLLVAKMGRRKPQRLTRQESSAAEHGGFSLARRVWGETPVRGEWGWMQAPVADAHQDPGRRCYRLSSGMTTSSTTLTT
jgi:hypothetical protein